ncbi:MAG TPA: hypothetical protein VHT03_10720 [Rhizomicrobium sp.]|nr:hypothetical protein [Rhizomicrobium sp.]
MPKNIAQWTGFAVTVIIVLGRDADVLTAVPLGIAAGMLASLFQAMGMQLRPLRTLPGGGALPAGGRAAVPGTARLFQQRSVAAIVHAVNAFRPKRRHTQFAE